MSDQSRGGGTVSIGSPSASDVAMPDAEPGPWRRVPGWLHRVMGDEVLLVGDDNDLVTLTGVVVPVWIVLDTPGSAGDLARRIADRWPDRPVDTTGVQGALETLEQGGFVINPDAGMSRVWGVTDDGEAVIEVVVARHLHDELARRWPLLGMACLSEKPAAGEMAGRLGVGDDGLFVPDGTNPVGQNPDEATWGVLEQTLTAVAVERLPHLVAVHAAVIARQGVALLVPASSGAGKSTLTVAAAEAGAEVLSDEYALIDPDTGLVTGWPRPVRVRGADGTEERLDLAVESEPLPVGLVAAVAYEPGTSNAWTPIAGSEIVLELLANTICARTRPDSSLDAAMAVARRAQGVKGVRGGAAEALRDLLALLDEGDPRPEPS